MDPSVRPGTLERMSVSCADDPRGGLLVRCLLIVVVLTLPVVGIWSSPAQAHSKLVRSNPAAGAAVVRPASVELQFSGVVSADLSMVEVRDGSGRAISEGKPSYRGGDRDTLAVNLAGGNADRHSVKWRAVFADGHAMEGSFVFDITASTSPTTATVIDSPATTAASGSNEHSTMGHSQHAAHASSDGTVLATSSRTPGDGTTGVIAATLGVFALVSALSGAVLRRLQN